MGLQCSQVQRKGDGGRHERPKCAGAHIVGTGNGIICLGFRGKAFDLLTPCYTTAGMDRRGGLRHIQGERSEGVGGAFGGRTLWNTALHQLLDCTHTKAHKFTEEWNRETMQVAV